MSALHFSKDCFVRVCGDLADVVHRLEMAQNGGVDVPPAEPAPEFLSH